MAEIDQAEELPAGYSLKSILTSGEGRLKGHEKYDLGQGQGDHRKVDPLPADRQAADYVSQQTGKQRPPQNPQFGCQPHVFDQMAGDVGCAPEKSGMSEGKQTGV